MVTNIFSKTYFIVKYNLLKKYLLYIINNHSYINLSFFVCYSKTRIILYNWLWMCHMIGLAMQIQFYCWQLLSLFINLFFPTLFLEESMICTLLLLLLKFCCQFRSVQSSLHFKTSYKNITFLCLSSVKSSWFTSCNIFHLHLFESDLNSIHLIVIRYQCI